MGYTSEHRDAIQQLIGKRIVAIARGAEGRAGPAASMFPSFDDQICYEVYTETEPLSLTKHMRDWTLDERPTHVRGRGNAIGKRSLHGESGGISRR